MSIITLLATSICQTLFEAGYTAYFAGGFVRDLLLGTASDEIDIATSAPPSAIQKLFPRTIPVGISFGVVIVVYEGVNFEVATFRRDHPYHDGRHPDGVDFSTPEKDALRRDFTINGMFYDPLSDSVYDYVGGQEDLKNRLIRAIGNPEARFTEDRLRMVRAVRFAARLGFTIDKGTEKAIQKLAATLFPSVSMERIWQEFCKMASYPHFDQALITLQRLGLLSIIFPNLQRVEIEQLVKRFSYFPLECPTIVYLLQLFPQATLEEHLELCDYLKTSNDEKKLVTFFSQPTPNELYEWAHFYAHPHSTLFIEVEAAKLDPPQRGQFLEEHEKRRKKLSKHIKRIEEKRPLVSSVLLREHGIKPGPRMGELLKQAEEIAINEDIHSAEEVLSFMQIGS